MMQIRLSGFGGQGLILAGIILGEAAVIEGKEVVQTQDYGPEARGGASKAECIISNYAIDYPKVTTADLLLCLQQEAYNKYHRDVSPEGIIIIDDAYVREYDPGSNVLALPITRTAVDEIGDALCANIIALGIIAGLTNVVSHQAIERAVLLRVPKGTEYLNRKSLDLGWAMVDGLIAPVTPNGGNYLPSYSGALIHY